MTNPTPLLSPPPTPNLLWRPLASADRDAVSALIAACIAQDGGIPFIANDESFLEQFVADVPHPALGGFDDVGQLVACAAARLDAESEENRVTLVGNVHPAYRRRGLGNFLMTWAIAQAQALLASAPQAEHNAISIRTESITPDAETLYARFQFTQAVASNVMRHALQGALPTAPFPPDITLAQWSDALAEKFFEAFHASFRDRPGFVAPSAQEWISCQSDDPDFSPDLSWLASHAGQPVGFIVCAPRWLSQVGVRPEWRGRGLGAAFVAQMLQQTQREGGTEVLLDVNVNNPTATRVYARLGFEVVGRRGRYVRKSEGEF